MAYQKQLVFSPMTDEEKITHIKKAYSGFIGNETAVNRLTRIDFDALGHRNHLCRELALAFMGSASTGKTELVRRHAKANMLPLVEISPKSIKTTHDIFDEIQRVCTSYNIPVLEVNRPKFYKVPPINLFVDEVHALGNNVVQGLLKATEYKDCMLVTEKGYVVDTFDIHWIIATTDRGKLFDAFDTRFTQIELNYCTQSQLAQIVKLNHPDLPESICETLAAYCPKITRKTLALAREVKLAYKMNKNWTEAVKIVANDHGLDESGLNKVQRKVLQVLKYQPVAANRLPYLVGVKAEELEKFVMPYLMEGTEDQEACVTVTHKGYALTEFGQKKAA